MISKVANFHVFLHIAVIEVFLHPANITPVEIPISFSTNILREIVSVALWGKFLLFMRVNEMTERIEIYYRK